MTTRIRLRRMGANKRPFYRVVVADQRSPRNGRFIENIGRYHPLEDPSLIEIDEERALYWLRVGAQPSDQVRNLMDKTGIWGKFTSERPSAALGLKPARETKPSKEKISKKAASKAAAGAEQVAPAEQVAHVTPAEEAAPEPTEVDEAVVAEAEAEAAAAPEPEATEAAAPEPEATAPEAAEAVAPEPEATEETEPQE